MSAAKKDREDDQELPHKRLLNAQSQLFNSQDYADLMIRCRNEVWKAHRNILCPRNKFFKACCEHGFKEEQSKEIDLSEDDPVAVEGMLIYLYTLDYPDWRQYNSKPWDSTKGTIDLDGFEQWAADYKYLATDGTKKPMTGDEAYDLAGWLLKVHVGLFKIANKYDLAPLKDKAKKYAVTIIRGRLTFQDFWAFIADLWNMPQPAGAEDMRDAVMQSILADPAILSNNFMALKLAEHGSILLDISQQLAKELQKYRKT